MAPRAGLSPRRVAVAAGDVADRDGLAALSLGDVAAELGVRPPSLYNHVAGLDGLRRELTVHALETLGTVVQGAAVGRAGPVALREIAHAIRDFARQHPGRYAATVPADEGDDRIRTASRAVVTTVLTVLAGMGLEGDDALHATRGLRSAVHGFVHLELHGGFGLDLDLDRSFERLVEDVITGIVARTR